MIVENIKMNIVICEQNKPFRESLMTALSQIKDFNVIMHCGYSNLQFKNIEFQVDVFLMDYSIGDLKCCEIINKALAVWPEIKFLVMANYKEKLPFSFIKTGNYILKSSSKKEFEIKIRDIIN